MNPILPVQHFVPDVEARQWSDGRVYLYGSYDIYGGTNYCSYEYHVFSSDNMIDWTHHGCSFRSARASYRDGFHDSDVSWTEKPLFAPDCVYKDGKYYMYFCLSDKSEGVAESDKAYGPFKKARTVEGAHLDAIDPAALVDKDGKAYVYWGQGHSRGAQLNETMDGIIEETLVKSLVNEEEDGFHEGSSMRRRGDYYYLVYADSSRKKPTCLGYAMSQSPLGPFEKKGIIIDNDGCDNKVWNNHGSIEEVNGQWYVFYHRSSASSIYNRRVCVEPIEFNEDGTINEVEMTTQGVQGPLDPTIWMDAYRACNVSGEVRTCQVEAVSDNAKLIEAYEYLAYISPKDSVVYKYFNFDKKLSKFEALVSSHAYGGEIVLRLDSLDGEEVGRLRVHNTGGWEQWEKVTCEINKEILGVHSLYLVFEGLEQRLMSVKSFRFR